MTKRYLGMFAAVLVLSAMSGQAVDLASHMSVGAEYHFASGDTDNAPGAYVTYEVELPDPVSARVGLDYFGSDYTFGEYSGSFSSVGLELLFLVSKEAGIWRPYVGAGGAQYFNSFDGIDFPDKLGIIIEGGTGVQLNDTLKAHFSLRHMSLRPDHLDARIGQIEMDAVVVRAGLLFDF